MGLFTNYTKEGPGVDKDAPRKTGIGRFFELVGRDMNGKIGRASCRERV